MIDVHCPDCGRVLIGTRQIVRVAPGPDGMEVVYVCGCGRIGAELVRRAPRGRRAPSPLAPAVARPDAAVPGR